MTGTWLILLRLICILQFVLAAFYSFSSLSTLILNGKFFNIFQVLAFGLVGCLPALALFIMGNNYPDKAIVGRLKKNFNRLFLINILLISFLAGAVIYDYRQLRSFSDIMGKSVFSMQFGFFTALIISAAMLVFHLLILYGLYWLRVRIYNNFLDKKFEFENEEAA